MPTITNATKLNYVQTSFLNRFAFKDVGTTVNRGTDKAPGEVTFGDVVKLGKAHGLTRKALVEIVDGASAEKLAEIKAANKAAIRKGRKASSKTKKAAAAKGSAKAKTAKAAKATEGVDLDAIVAAVIAAL